MTYLAQQQDIKTLQQAVLHYSDSHNCIDFMVSMRWPDGVVRCPTCNSEAVTWLPTRQLFQCKSKHPKRQFSVKVGTIMEDSPIALSKWLVIAWMISNCRNGISSYEVARTIGITQKSAWFVLHRLRKAMQMQDEVLSGEVEADECYYGGQLKNKHRNKLKQGKHKDKTPVFGMVQRGGKVIAHVTPDAKVSTVFPLMRQSIAPDATVYTDSYTTYDHLHKEFTHFRINHLQDAYVVGPVHTNTIENFWSCLKRTLKGTYVAVLPKHLIAYVIESCFRFNVRKGFTEQARFGQVIEGIQGKRLTYRELVANA